MNLKGRFPHASKSFLEANGELPAQVVEQPVKSPLVKTSQGKAAIRGRFRVVYTGCFVRPLDTDNLAGGLKACQDVLRIVGLLPSDDPYAISVTWEQQKVSHFADEKLIIEITKP